MLTNERINEIKQKIIDNKLYNKSLNQIARENNIEVVFADLSLVSDKPLSWAILYDANRFKIFIEKSDNTKRQRFTYAHELWHYFLHEKYLKENNIIKDGKESYLFRDSEYKNVSKEMLEKEYEANEFAWILLMPEEKIKEAIKIIWDLNITILADFFEVSLKAMNYRLTKLWLKEYDE